MKLEPTKDSQKPIKNRTELSQEQRNWFQRKKNRHQELFFHRVELIGFQGRQTSITFLDCELELSFPAFKTKFLILFL